MSGYSQPTHIDFMTAFKDEHQHRGYWILTWIFPTQGIVAWRRLIRGWEIFSGNKETWFDYIGRDPKFYQFYLEDSAAHHEFLEKTLHDHMKKHGFEGELYEYWKPYQAKIEAAKEDVRRNPEKYVRANAEPELHKLSKNS
jgi:hypothetical protein